LNQSLKLIVEEKGDVKSKVAKNPKLKEEK